MGGVALYGAYAANVNLDSSALKDAAVDCSTTWDGSEFQSPTVRIAKEWRKCGMLVLKNRSREIYEQSRAEPRKIMQLFSPHRLCFVHDNYAIFFQ